MQCDTPLISKTDTHERPRGTQAAWEQMVKRMK